MAAILNSKPRRQRHRAQMMAFYATLLAATACSTSTDSVPEPGAQVASGAGAKDDEAIGNGSTDAAGGEDVEDSSDASATTNESAPSDPGEQIGASTLAPSEDAAWEQGEQGNTSHAEACERSDGREVGSVVKVHTEQVTVDCEVVGGGERIRHRSVVATDDKGAVSIRLDGGPTCRLSVGTEARVEEQELEFLAAQDEAVCATAFLIEVPGGTIRPLGGAAGLLIVVDDVTRVSVVDGLATYTPASRECNVLLGPRQQLETGDALSPGAFAPEALPPSLRQAASDLGLATEPPLLDSGVVPGLADAIDADQGSVAVDGNQIGSTGTPDVISAIPEILVGDRITLTLAQDAIVIGPSTNPVVDSQVPDLSANPGVVATTSDLETEDESTTDESTTDESTTDDLQLTSVPVLVDPDGRVWTAELEPGSTQIDVIRAQLLDAIRDGSYGRTYEHTFGALPDYGPLVPPELLQPGPGCE